MTSIVSIDTNVIVALVDAHDKWHQSAIALRDALLNAGTQLVYFDCVINEAIGVIGRRAEEQKRSDQFEHLLDGLAQLIPESSITWSRVKKWRVTLGIPLAVSAVSGFVPV